MTAHTASDSLSDTEHGILFLCRLGPQAPHEMVESLHPTTPLAVAVAIANLLDKKRIAKMPNSRKYRLS